MIVRLCLFAALALGFSGAGLHAHEEIVSGPNGGRVLTTVTPHTEFFVTPERKVQITFVGEDGKTIAPSTQSVVVTTGARSAPAKLTFTQKGDVLLSETALPAGNNLPTVVQVKAAPDAKTQVARFNLNMSVCSECDRPEYACICKH